MPPGEILEGLTTPPSAQDNPFARLMGRGGSSSSGAPARYEVDPADPTPFERQIFDQVRA
jgi:hypothetical protein